MVYPEMTWLESLYNEHYDRLFKLITWRIRDCPDYLDEAHDLVQEVFLLAARKDIHDHPNPIAWLMLVADNLCKNYVRSNQRRMDKMFRLQQQHIAYQSNPAPHPFESAGDSGIDALDLMMAIQGRLSESDMTLLVEYCINGTPIEEISRRTGLSPNCLHVRIHRIRKIIETLLAFLIIASISNAAHEFTFDLHSFL